MRIYLELIELLPEGSTEEPDFIRVDVTEWPEEDVGELISILEEHAKVYEKYVLQKHVCYHEEGQACEVYVISGGWL